MKKHAVFVAGKRFILLSDDKAEYVNKIAQEINQEIIDLTASNPTLDGRACALLCALNQADDKYKEKMKNKRFSDKAKDIMVQSDKHAKTIIELKEEIKKAKALNETQLHQIADKNVEIKDLSNKVKETADENIKLKEEIKNLKKEIEEIRKQQEKSTKAEEKQEKTEKVSEKTSEKIEEKIKKQPFQNPVAKVKKPVKTAKAEEKKTNIKEQMSLFEDE